MNNVIPTRRQRLPGALWVGVALMALALVVLVSSEARARNVQRGAWQDGYDAARAELLATVADAYRAGLSEGIAQTDACTPGQADAPRSLRASCCEARP